MQCPETPQYSVQQSLASPSFTEYESDTPSKRAKVDGLTQKASFSRGNSHTTENPFESRLGETARQESVATTTSPSTTNFSRRLRKLRRSDDIFASQSSSSVAALRFQDAARRLALSPLSHSVQNQSTPTQERHESSQNSIVGVTKRQSFTSNARPAYRHYTMSQSEIERDITSAQKETLPKQSPLRRPFPTSFSSQESSQNGSPARMVTNKNRAPGHKTVQNPRNFSRPARIVQSTSTKLQARNFSRPVRSARLETGQGTIPCTPIRSTSVPVLSISLPPSQSEVIDRIDHAHNDSTVVQDDANTVSVASRATSISKADHISHEESAPSEEQIPETASVHLSTRESFESAVSECLGDKRLQLSNWEIWLQRIVFALFVFTANIALGLAYMGAFKHPYLLAILGFMKSKDIISTVSGLAGITHDYLRHLVWPPKTPDSRWILSLVCAYAETEEQILKTVLSLARGSTQPHKQAICIILDGKPRDILSKMTSVKSTVQRPYTTWRGNRGDITVNSGYLEGIPLVLVEKVKNAGKKDSLILGHDLFNYPRKDMPHSTQMLRREIWQTVLPRLITTKCGKFEKFDFIFCTDADSTIHDLALRRLADALCRANDAIAACGVLFAEFGDRKTEYSPWHLFQQFQYTFGQYVRRQAESMWGRVTCLPGCITMIVVRPETGQAVSEYARPVIEHNLFRHQVQYLGTDRRFTWCMMSQGKHLRTIFVPSALSETVVPDGISHYLSQRRRWASNAYFNDFFYMLGPRQRLITRLFAAIDIVRLSLVYYRVFNTGYFLHGLVTNFYIIKIIPTLVVSKTPATWYLLFIVIREPFLRKRLHKILLGMCINQIISPILSVIVFTNVIFHMGSQAWGKTGASTQGPAAGAVTAPVISANTPMSPSQGWSPRSLAQSVRTAIRGVTPEPGAEAHHQDTKPADQDGTVAGENQRNKQRSQHSSPLKSNPPDLPNSTASPIANASARATGIDQAEMTPVVKSLHTLAQDFMTGVISARATGIDQAEMTPVVKSLHTLAQDAHPTPSTLSRRTPYHQRRMQSTSRHVKEAPVRMTDDSTAALSYDEG